MVTRYPRSKVLAITALLAYAGCSSSPPIPHDLLDERTGVTVTVVGAPTLFARVRDDGATAVHDYVSLVALQNDNAGKYTDLLLMYRWSESSLGIPSAPEANAGRLQIDLDGRSLELQPLEPLPADLPQPKVRLAPVAADVVTYAYVSDLDTLRRIASSHQLAVRLPQESSNVPFALWHDGRQALVQFVDQYSKP